MEVKNLSQLNFEAPPGINLITVELKATDNGSPPLSFFGNITIIANDVNEPPSNVRLIHASYFVPENVTINARLGQLWVDNPEGVKQTIRYKLLTYLNQFQIITTHASSASSYLVLTGELNIDYPVLL